MKTTAAQIEALRKMTRYTDGLLGCGNMIRFSTILVLQRAGLVEIVDSRVRKCTGRMGNALPTDHYYHDWTARITDAGRNFITLKE